jgi:DNA-binding CsgD family transcriptional regulator
VREDVPLAVPQLISDRLRAFGKLGVSGRTAAVTTAIERGLLPPPGANR